MSKMRPKFMDSEYFYVSAEGTYKLKDEAPEALKKELEEYLSTKDHSWDDTEKN